MVLTAGFAQADITPPLGTHKIGWLEDIIAESVADSLFASHSKLAPEAGDILADTAIALIGQGPSL